MQQIAVTAVIRWMPPRTRKSPVSAVDTDEAAEERKKTQNPRPLYFTGSPGDPDTLINIALGELGISSDELRGPGRAAPLAHARQLVMLLLREECSLSLSEIGQLLGGRDHTTVLYGVARAARLMEELSGRLEYEAVRDRRRELRPPAGGEQTHSKGVWRPPLRTDRFYCWQGYQCRITGWLTRVSCQIAFRDEAGRYRSPCVHWQELRTLRGE